MNTLLNPLQYEPKLAALNELARLTFDDTVTVTLDMGALDRQSVSDDGPVRAAFLRGDGSAKVQKPNQHGAFTTMSPFGGTMYTDLGATVIDLTAVCEWVGLTSPRIAVGGNLYLLNMLDEWVEELTLNTYQWYKVSTRYITVRSYGPPGSSSDILIERLLKA